MEMQPFDSEVLSIERSDHVATLYLDRPEARNAMGAALFEDLPRAMELLDGDDDVRAIVLAARGPHFCVGLDLKSMGGVLTGGGAREGEAGAVRSNAATYEAIRELQDAVSSLAATNKPVIAAIHGYCIGGGVDLIAACDLRVASADAVFSVREAKVAIVADLGSLQRLPGIIPAGHLSELALSGRDIDAARAERIGLVNDVLDDASGALAHAQGLAAEIAANSPLAVQGTKAVLAANEGRTIEEGLDFVATWNTLYLRSDDLKEAMSAFLEKRPPRFTGR
jgi:enoyl-CoA hydratase